MGAVGSFTTSLLTTGDLSTSLKAGMIGGITAAAFAGISHGIYQGAWSNPHVRLNNGGYPELTIGQHAAKVVLQSGVSGLQSHLGGHKFSQGFFSRLFPSAAAELYDSYTGFRASLLPGTNGDPRLPCDAAGSTCYEYDRGMIPTSSHGYNVIGLNQALNPAGQGNLFTQGGTLSKALNLVPGLNATAGYHDTLFGKSLAFTPFNNVATMLPSAVLGYLASYSEAPIYGWRR